MPATTTRRELFTKLTNPTSKTNKGIVYTPAPTPSFANHILNRLTYGARAVHLQAFQTQGFAAWLTEQLSPESIDDSACEAKIQAIDHETLEEDWATLFDRIYEGYSSYIRPRDQVRHATWLRRIYSKRQLQEKLVEFWHDHFNIYSDLSSTIRALWPKWDATLREHALGNFKAMLIATAQHPCMLYYLDNYRSTDGGPNENYARELMELHTMGAINYQVEDGYIDQDVYEASRCFTGWTINFDRESADRGQFLYEHDDHDRFIKFFLGEMIPGDQPALADGVQVLETLADHPGTARHIAEKLCRRFVSDSPPESLMQSTADLFHAQRDAPDQIRQVIEHIVTSEAFAESTSAKFKRPADWVASAMRVLLIDYTTDDAFRWLFDGMGQPTFMWRPPDGAPATAGHWQSSSGMLYRWNWVGRITKGSYVSRGLEVHLHEFISEQHATARAITDWVIQNVLGRGVSSTTYEAMLNYIADGRSWDLELPADQREQKVKYAAALLTMSPEFMHH